MKVSIACPPTEELLQLLDGSLSGERQQECTQHMDSCSGCQAKLEDLATGGSNLSRVVNRIHEDEPVADSAYWTAVRSLDASLQKTIVPPSTSRKREVSLSFLQPASDSVYLGRIAHFDIMRILGRGGMGIVFEAFDSRLQRNVAIKVLDPDYADDEIARQRFCREARAAASITHENVIAVHQVEKSAEDGLPYLVMQLIAGESLEQRLERVQKLPLREVVRIGMQAAHGLAAAHAQGLIHRDIKPGNILLESAGDRVKLTDFGLARVADDVKLTRSGFISGTPLYMAPEQAQGEEADHRSDLFSLGAVLYEMCAGRPPFIGNSALVILKQISETKHRPLRELNPAIPDWFADTIDSLLAKKPADRIQSATHLAELLDFQWAMLKTTSEDLPTVCQIEVRKRKIRNRIIGGALAVTFLALGLLGGSFLANRNNPVAPAGDTVTTTISSAEPLAVLSAKSGPVWSVSFDPASKTVLMGVEDGTVRLWDIATESIKATLPAHRGLVWSARFCPSGERFATAGDDGRINLWKLSESEPFKTFEHRNAVRGLAFGHNNRTIYAGGRDGILRVWSVDSDQPLAETQVPGAVFSVAVSPDNETLATAGSDKVIRLWNAKNLTQKMTLEGHTGPVYGVTFSQSGRRVASAGWDRTVRVWDTGGGQLVKSWLGHEGDIWGIAYSPDGNKLATGGHDGAVKLWDAESGNLLATYLGHKVAIHAVAFNDDGTLLASGGRDGAVRIWKIE